MIDGKSSVKEAVVRSNSSATCLLPVLPTSTSLQLTVVASTEDASPNALKRLPQNAWRVLHVYAAAPKALSAKLGGNLKTIIVAFDTGIAGKKSCSDYFESSVLAKLGTRARCYKGSLNQIAISLGVGATIVPGYPITLRDDSIFAYREKMSYAASGSVDLEGSTYKPFEIVIVGPSQVGICDTIEIKAMAYGNTDVRQLSFSWDVSFARDTNKAHLTSQHHDDLKAISRYLYNLPSDTYSISIRSGLVVPSTMARPVVYNFTVLASNFIKQQTGKAISVQRMNARVPVVTILGGMQCIVCFSC